MKISGWKIGTIYLKNAVPFAGSIVLAWLLIGWIGTGKHVWHSPISLDAKQWHESSSTPKVKPLPVAGLETNKEPGELASREAFDGECIHKIFTLTTFALILLNTLLYLFDSFDAATSPIISKFVRGVVMACELLTFLWMIKIVSGIEVAGINDEYAALFLFVVFTIVDAWTWRIAHVKEKDAREKKIPGLGGGARFAMGQTLYVDLPVVLGIGTSICLTYYFDKRFSGVGDFVFAFFAGTTVMHLATSQFIFAILAIKKDLSDAKASLITKGESVAMTA